MLSYVAGGALIIGGLAVLATTPFGGLGSTVLGSALLGMGIGGLTYNVTQSITHKPFSWTNWLAQVGIGGVAGVISGGFAAGAGAIVGAAADVGKAAFFVGGLGRIGVNTLLGGVVGNGMAGFTAQILNNVATHAALWSGVGFATALGGILGGLTGAASEGVAARLARNFSASDYVNSLSLDEQCRLGLRGPNWATEMNNLLDRESEGYVPETKFNNFIIALPGSAFTGLDAAVNAIWDDLGWPRRF